MSRIGKLPIEAPSGVTVNLKEGALSVKGPKGELDLVLTDDVVVTMEGNSVQVSPRDEDDRRCRAMWGTIRARIAALKGNDLELNLGFSHPVVHKAPDGISFKCAKPTEIKIEGADKQAVGQVAAEIRRYRPPEPYKGKGIRFAGEQVRRKEGKKK